jgi:outer membrane lipoprotein
MSNQITIGFVLLLALATSSCAGLSRETKEMAEPNVPFATLVGEADTYRGKTVIVGGYILQLEERIQNLKSEASIEILQAPLGPGDEPGSVRDSEGTIVVLYDGILDLSQYKEGRKITAAGTLRDCREEPSRFCEIEGQELYIWPEPAYRGGSVDTWPGYRWPHVERTIDQIYQALPEISGPGP